MCVCVCACVLGCVWRGRSFWHWCWGLGLRTYAIFAALGMFDIFGDSRSRSGLEVSQIVGALAHASAAAVPVLLGLRKVEVSGIPPKSLHQNDAKAKGLQLLEGVRRTVVIISQASNWEMHKKLHRAGAPSSQSLDTRKIQR